MSDAKESIVPVTVRGERRGPVSRREAMQWVMAAAAASSLPAARGFAQAQPAPKEEGRNIPSQEAAAKVPDPNTSRGYGTDPRLVKIARDHHKTVAQIVLRWEVQSGIVTIPKSVHRERIVENAAIFNFTLTDAEMKQVNALDQNTRVGPDPLHVAF